MQFITSTPELEALCSQLIESDYVTVDTEFMRESTYWPNLCLIQVATDTQTALIDPLAKSIDLSSFFKLMSDTSVVKVFHSARQDIEIIYNQAKTIPAPLFDSQVAAMVCGFGDQVSYSMLVKKITNHDLDKTSQFTDWSKRPLSNKQLEYALADVTHLRDIYKKLREQLEKSGRSTWLDEEMKTLTTPETYVTKPETAWRRLKMRVKSRRALGILIELAAWRESLAQNANIPRNRVLKDDALYDIANQSPKNSEQLAALRTISQGFARSDKAQDVLAAVKKGKGVDIETIPPLKKGTPLDANATAILELLRVLLKAVAANEGVAPKVIASTADLEKLAANDEADIPALSGWRYELFGRDALRLKQGDLVLAIRDNKIKAITPDNL